ncbi:prenylcysteine oxidase-like isoform X2 [Erpetoichthys calabaricus]|uniref:prenylcysteine oxidase-like isoform X2 n=1 Tax=Erpetoichthys calabaricus TaxID=27687 RepID=UPI0022349620|nr:prenylcysteine oxidase-like isoform X2 [Erpetoichthys calabaricus]
MAVVIFLRFFLHLLLVFWCGVFVHGQEAEQGHGTPPSRIAVIGSGVGGTATAHFLRQHFGPDLQIDVFEKGSVGGRLATVTVNNQDYESGGSVIHSLNLHMQDFVKQIGLKYRRNVAGKTAVFNGKQIILEETDWYLLDLFRLWWRYGFSFIRLQMWVEETMEKFMRIYKYQAHGYAFSSVEQLLHSLGGGTFINMTRHTLSESLLELGVSQRFIDEVIAAVMRANYGQSVSVPAFVGAVSLAGAQTNLWAVEGGNKLVCSGLLTLAKTNLIQAKVTTVSLHKTDTIQYKLDFEAPKERGSELYDIVIVAAPLQNGMANITFENFDPPIPEMSGSYHHTVASIVHGYLNSTYFGFPDPKLFPFASICTVVDDDLFFNTVGNVCPVNVSTEFKRKQPQDAAVWKVFSQQPLEKKDLKTLFKSYYSVQVTDWQAYPEYGSTDKIPPIILHDNMYYLNGIEWAASAMEMSSVAAKNLALLAYHRWNQQTDMIDQKELMHKIKTEL